MTGPWKMTSMTPLRLGQLVRAARHHLGLRQIDIAVRAAVSKVMVSRVERGDFRFVRWQDLERICAAVEIRVDLIAIWRGAEGAALLDREHAAIVETLVRDLVAAGWETLIEYGFNHYGDRGSVDILAWHAGSRSLLIVEVKTEIVDVQDLVSSLTRKTRVVPGLVAVERGWIATTVNRLLVVRDSRSARRVIERHRATFAATLPARTVAARRWISSPAGRLSAVMFVAEERVRILMQRRCRVRRVRTPRPNLSPHESGR